MLFNVIFFKGTDKTAVIRTSEPIVLKSNDSEFVDIVDDSTGEITSFRPVDVLRISSIDESRVKQIKTPEDHKKPAKKTPKTISIS